MTPTGAAGVRARLRLWRRLAARFARTRPLRRSAVVVGVITGLLMVLFIGLSEFSLTAAHRVERDLGRFDAQTQLVDGISLRGDPRPVTAAVTAARSAGGRDVTVQIASYDVRVDTAPHAAAGYYEMAWTADPFPQRWTLRSGHWPTRPGQVVLTAVLADVTHRRSSVPVLSGNSRFQVVGTVTDRYATRSAEMLAAPGTWHALPWSRLGVKYPTLSGSVTLLWTGGHDQQVSGALVTLLAAQPGALPRAAIVENFTQYLLTRPQLLASSPTGWVQRLPIAWSVPSRVLPLLGVLAVFAINDRRLRRNLATLRAVGVNARDAALGVGLAAAGWSLLAAAAGAAAGIAAGITTRPLAQAENTSPLAPLPPVTGPLLRLGVAVAVGCAAALLAALVARRGSPAMLTTAPRTPRGWVRPLRWTVTGAAAAFAVRQAVAARGVPDALFLLGTVTVVLLLVTPDLLGAVLRLPTRGPRRRLASRQLRFDRRRSVGAVCVIAAALGPVVSVLTLTNSASVSDQHTQISPVPDHQLLISPGDIIQAPPAALVRLVTASVGDHGTRIAVRTAGTDTRFVQPGTGGPVLLVDSVTDAARVNNAPLTPAEADTLSRGGAVLFSAVSPPLPALAVRDATTNALTPVPGVPVTVGPFQTSWAYTNRAVMLTVTARAHHLPVGAAQTLFTGVDPATVAAAEKAATDAGWASTYLHAYRAPDASPIPPVLADTTAALAVLVPLTVFAGSRAQAATLRGYSAGLLAIGLPRRWVRDVLSLEVLGQLALATAVGLTAGIVPIAVAVAKVPSFGLYVPWLQLGEVLAGCVAAALLALLVAGRHLTPRERGTGVIA